MKKKIHPSKYIHCMDLQKAGQKRKRSTFRLLSIAMLGFTLSLTSCEKVLNQEPRNEVDEKFAITDLRGAQAAVAGLYNQIQDNNYYGANFLIMSDVTSDQAQSIGTWDFYREMDTYQVSTGNTENGYLYSRAYKAIYVANTILEEIPKITAITEAQKNTLSGHAYFVRGLAYFDLTRIFGGIPGIVGTLGVPIVLTTDKGNIQYPTRATLQASYDQVNADLLKSLELLPESNLKSQASKGAARALLSRLNLYLGKNAEAESYATEVINDAARYSLVGSFTDIFSTKLSTEAILELTYTNADQSSIRNWYYPTTIGGRGELIAHPSFVAKAKTDVNDVRGTLFGTLPNNQVYPTKFGKIAGGIDNIPVLRVAEMYLNRAEARAKIGSNLAGAVEDLNKVRTRAKAGALSPVGQTDILNAIYNEQQLEFAYEGHSLHDYVRSGQALNKLVNLPRLNSPSIVSLPSLGRTLFPIPLFETNANTKVEQNEAYR